MASKELRAKLRERFPADKVLQRDGGRVGKLDYVPIQTVIERLLEATAEQESGYAWHGNVVFINADEGIVVVSGQLLIGGDSGFGVGSAKNKADLDMAVKTANSEALKNAAKNGFGVGLELWDADYRAELRTQRQLVQGNEAALKQAVWDIARERLAKDKPSLDEVAKLFGVKKGDLSDKDTLIGILEDVGRL